MTKLPFGSKYYKGESNAVCAFFAYVSVLSDHSYLRNTK